MQCALHICSRSTTLASQCGIVCLPNETVSCIKGSNLTSSKPYGPPMINDTGSWTISLVNCSEVLCTPSLLRRTILDHCRLCIFSSISEVSFSIICSLVPCLIGFTLCILTEFQSLLLYSSTSNLKSLSLSEMAMS